MTAEDWEDLDDWEIQRDGVFLSFKQIWNKSFKDKQDNCPQWLYPTFLHHQLLRCIVESHDKVEYIDSLVFRRFLGWRRSLQWCIVSAHSGVYEAIARELRFILEDLAQALYIDQKLGNSDIVSKTRTTSILEDLRLRGTRLIDKLEMDGAKQEMKSLYDVLCDYVHPSAELVQRIHIDDQFYFKFDESQFHTALELYSKVSDLILAFTISRFPKSIERFEYVIPVIDLEKEGYAHTAKVCEEKGVPTSD